MIKTRKKYKEGDFERQCRYCLEVFRSRATNAKHCSEECYNLAKRCRKYNLSYEEHRKMLLVHHCQICNTEVDAYLYNEHKRPDKSKRCIDHCHKTGKVRGILCDGCNVGLGSFGDNPKTLKLAIAYLEKHKC